LQSIVPSLGRRREARQQPSVLAIRKQADINLGTEVLAELKNYKSTNGDNNRARELSAILRRMNETVPFCQRPDLASFVNWKGNAAAPIHRWLRYREAYSPHLITKLGLGDKILDPFCGCGSILIGAAERGYTSAGIDINPLAVFASRVKLTSLLRPQLALIRAFVDGLGARMASRASWPLPALSIASKVFEPEILNALLRIRSMTESDFSSDKACRDFLHLAWIAVLEAVGSYFKEGNGIKYRNKKRLKTGYVHRLEGQWQYERFGRDQKQFVLDVFCSQVRMMLQDTKYWRKGRWRDQTVIQGNVLEMDELLERQKFNSVVFSPPYANRFDYFESMKVELWFGGFVDSYESIGRFRKASLRSHLGADLNRPYQRVDALEALIKLMDSGASSWRMGVQELLRGYFDDMRMTLRHCKTLLANGHCFIVVGNSAFAGVIIPTDVILANLGLECGFKKAEILVARHLTVAPQQRNQLSDLQDNMRESVVVLS
jgi:site-specific DNA-methyltransferase (adenine-specific)